MFKVFLQITTFPFSTKYLKSSCSNLHISKMQYHSIKLNIYYSSKWLIFVEYFMSKCTIYHFYFQSIFCICSTIKIVIKFFVYIRYKRIHNITLFWNPWPREPSSFTALLHISSLPVHISSNQVNRSKWLVP